MGIAIQTGDEVADIDGQNGVGTVVSIDACGLTVDWQSSGSRGRRRGWIRQQGIRRLRSAAEISRDMNRQRIPAEAFLQNR